MSDLIYVVPDSPESIKRIVEAALLSATQPMAVADFKRLFEEDVPVDTLRILLDELVAEWAGRPAELVQLASGWRLRTRAEYMPYIDRLNPERPQRYSRAVMETLAIIAYRQPVTRGDIEDIRGVTVATNVIKSLEERGWIDVIGYRETPGRPGLYATTKKFLDDLGLRNLNDLPALDLVDTAMLELSPSDQMLATAAVAELEARGLHAHSPEITEPIQTQPTLPSVEEAPLPASDAS